MGRVKETVCHSTLHALPIVVNGDTKFQRYFWLCTFLLAATILGAHLGRITHRFLKRDITTVNRRVTNETVIYPTVYLSLFLPMNVDFPVPYKVVQNTTKIVTYELSDWSSFASMNERDYELTFCAYSYHFQFGYIELSDPKDNVWSPLAFANIPIQRGKTILPVELYKTSMLPPPFSKCTDRYPKEFLFINSSQLSTTYSQKRCLLHCAMAQYASSQCNCSLRSQIGFDIPQSQSYAACRTTMDEATPEKCVFDEEQWIMTNFEELKRLNFTRMCGRLCEDECNFLEYRPQVIYVPVNYDDKCGPIQYTGTVELLISNRIFTLEEQEDYQLIEYLSEMIGILGAYLGISICTFAELLEIALYACFPFLRRVGLMTKRDSFGDVGNERKRVLSISGTAHKNTQFASPKSTPPQSPPPSPGSRRVSLIALNKIRPSLKASSSAPGSNIKKSGLP